MYCKQVKVNCLQSFQSLIVIFKFKFKLFCQNQTSIYFSLIPLLETEVQSSSSSSVDCFFTDTSSPLICVDPFLPPENADLLADESACLCKYDVSSIYIWSENFLEIVGFLSDIGSSDFTIFDLNVLLGYSYCFWQISCCSDLGDP